MKIRGLFTCPFNNNVDCPMDPEKDICGTCGWNPDVDEARRMKNRELRMAALTAKMKGEQKK